MNCVSVFQQKGLLEVGRRGVGCEGLHYAVEAWLDKVLLDFGEGVWGSGGGGDSEVATRGCVLCRYPG